MTNKKNPPAGNEGKKDKQPENILIDLSEEYYQSWLPALTIESSKFLGKRLSITQAQVTAIVRDNEILRASNINLHERVLHLEKRCSDLSTRHFQCYHALIKIKEGHNDFIDQTNAKLKKAGF